MRTTTILCTLLLPMLVLLAGGTTPDSADAPNEVVNDERAREQPQRVIVRVSRHREVAGTVELEDDDVLAVRTESGEVTSFIKSRVLQVVRLVEPEPEQKGIVLLRDGGVREGIIIEDAFEYVVIEIEGVRARLLRETVDRVLLEPTFEEQYEEMVDAISLQQRDRYLMFCRWLVEQRQYELADQHLDELIEHLDRNVRERPEAERLRRIVRAQLMLHRESEKHGSEADQTSRRQRQPALDRRYLISHDEVNLIRVYELDFARPPRLKIEPETIRSLIRDYGTSRLIPSSKTERDLMFRADPTDIMRLMFELRARELYGKVQVLSEPYAMNLFRERVHNRWLLNNCAMCHAQQDAGRFALYRQGYRNERVRYTNFLILERLDLGSDWPLINYDDPEMSLLIQYGLPQTHARLPHPEVRGWRPAFRSMDDRMVKDTVHWIESMMQPRPEYPIDFDPNEIVPAAEPSAIPEAGERPRLDEPEHPERLPR